MVVRSREDYTYIEIYRPVEAGLEQFRDRVMAHGLMAFGTRTDTRITMPVIETEGENSELTLQNRGIEVPKLEVYPLDRLRLPLLERRVEPEMRYAGAFRRGVEGLIKHADDKTAKQSLRTAFREIGEAYDIADQTRVSVTCKSLNIPVDPGLEHLGLEVTLPLDPRARVTRMLIKQAGVCLRGLPRKAANPWSPTALEIPFCRMPADAEEHQIDRFIYAVAQELPVRVQLGRFKDIQSGTSFDEDEPSES